MTERTRYRVTGSVFLVAVAFIVLPMIFDGSGLPPVEVPSIDPRESALEARRMPREQAVVAPAVLSEAAALRESVDDDGYMDGAARIGEPVLQAERGRPQQAAAAVVEEGAIAEERSHDESAWAVQLASFSDRANAVALRDRLRADGYEAMLSNTRHGSVTSTRVAIGPILSRDAAVQLQHELSQRYQLAPIVVAFQP
jgi:DedD protein